MIKILLTAVIILDCSIKSFAQNKSEPEIEKYSPELKEKAESGDAEAQYKLGRCYYFGCGITKNQEEAFQWYMKSAQKGNSFGQAAVGASYAGGLGIEKNENAAFEWMKKSAEQGNTEAEYALGVFYYNAKGTKKDEIEANKWLQKAADNGHQMAVSTLKQLNERPLLPYSDELLKKAEMGDAVAQFNIADCFFYGKGVPADKAQGIKWLTKAADSGDAISQFNLGVVYLQGLGVEKDVTKGTALLQKASAQGNEMANKLLAALSQTRK
jgi:hypothetical protein